MRVVDGASVTDTISAILPKALTVEVTDASGHPAVGRVVAFEVSFARPGGPGTTEYQTASLGANGQAGVEWQLTVPTDASGRAAVQVRLGEVVGDAVVHISVPDLGYATDARYTVLAGAADHVVASPGDSVAYVGGGYRLSAAVTDRVGDALPAQSIVYSIASGGATVDADGSVVATSVGRVRILAQAGGVSGTAWMSVPPRALVATQDHEPDTQGPIGIYLMELDGSGRTLLASGIDNARVSGQGFSWSPDGADLVIARGDSIDLVSPGSAERRILALNGPVWLGARYSRDGTWIYFARPDSGVARVHPDGSGMEVIGGPTIGGWRPSPSHDEASIAYGSSRTPCGVQDCIRVLDLATRQDRVYPDGRDWLVRGRNSAWSPVEDLVAYAFDSDVNDTGVGVIRSDGTDQRVLATDLYGVNWMDFSPDGKWLLVGSVNAPVNLFEVATGARLPLATLPTERATAWRP